MRAALILVAFSVSVLGGELPEDLRTASPNEQFRVRVVKVGDTRTRKLELRSLKGKLLYSSPSQIDGTDVLDFFPEHLRWSADSKVLAIAGGYSRNIQTYLFAWDGARFQQISLPALAADYDNPWIVPVEWKGHSLSLKISGPHAGKARDYGYSGTATIAVDLTRKSATKIAERIK
jgi:hypothetical protein